MVSLVLRDKVYKVKAGMTLLAALQKVNIFPETVIASRDGELILEDEILRNGEEIQLVSVISGGSIESATAPLHPSKYEHDS